MTETILKQFENPDEGRVFDKGRFEIIHIGGLTIGRASYEPGWKWSMSGWSFQGERLPLSLTGRQRN
jgi:hypothetical protein